MITEMLYTCVNSIRYGYETACIYIYERHVKQSQTNCSFCVTINRTTASYLHEAMS